MKTIINNVTLEGRLYDHSLKMKTTGENSKAPGTEYISGKINIATDEDCTNVISVRFTYVTAKTSKGHDNSTFPVLKGIIDGNIKTVLGTNKEAAAKLKVSTALNRQEFYTDRNGTIDFVSVLENNGGFIHVMDNFDREENQRSMFYCDMIITNVILKEADPEKNTKEMATIKGVTFDYGKRIVPVEFSVVNPKAISYFVGLEASKSNPFFTKVWGCEVSTTVVKTYTEESAFGEPEVRQVKNIRRDFIITGAAKYPYDWNSEETITVDEFKTALADREMYLAGLKDEYTIRKNGVAPLFADSGSDVGSFFGKF